MGAEEFMLIISEGVVVIGQTIIGFEEVRSRKFRIIMVFLNIIAGNTSSGSFYKGAFYVAAGAWVVADIITLLFS